VRGQDSEEITNIELADAFQQMWAKRRYNEIFFMIDTCQVIIDTGTFLTLSNRCGPRGDTMRYSS
jgi:hypothetical protein